MALVERKPIILGIGQGRAYDCGAMRAVFKADGIETRDRYSVSEWWLEPNSSGPGAHSHEKNDELFLVIEGRPRTGRWFSGDVSLGGQDVDMRK